MINNKGLSGRQKNAIYFIMATFFTLILIFPIYWMIISSFKSEVEIFALKPTFFPQSPTVYGYVKMFTTGSGVPFIATLRNSIAISVITTVITTLLSVPAAYALARFNYRFVNKTVLFMFLISQMLPQVLFLAPLFIIFKGFNLQGTYFSPSIYVTLHSLPFSVLILRPYFINIPKDLEDSATIDGCNKFTCFVRIMLPLAYPIIIVVIALSFLWGWGDLMGSVTYINKPFMQPLTMNMFRAMAVDTMDWTMLMAFSAVIVVPATVVFLSLQRFIIGGLTAGAVKG
jgi:multiple sugar transport system permease protein